MFETFTITLREGIEAFLIVAISLAYLEATGRAYLAKAVYAGITTAVAVSALGGVYLAELAQNPYWEGGLAMIAGLLVLSLTVVMMRNAKNIRGEIHNRLENTAGRTGLGAQIGVFAFIVLMIAREGMETALMMGSLAGNVDAASMLSGAVAGLVTAAGVGVLWVKGSHLINLRLFMQVTGIFLSLFAAYMFIYGVHEFTEMNAMPLVDNAFWHEHTENFAHGGLYGQIMQYGMVVVPAVWLALAGLKRRFSGQGAHRQQPA